MQAVLHQLRERAGLSKEDLAEAIGMDGSYYGRLERGKRELRASHLGKLRRALKLSDSEFLRLTLWAASAAERLQRADGLAEAA